MAWGAATFQYRPGWVLVNGCIFRCGIFGFCLLSFPQNKKKIYKLIQLTVWVTDIGQTSKWIWVHKRVRLPSRTWKFEYINEYGMATNSTTCTRLWTQISGPLLVYVKFGPISVTHMVVCLSLYIFWTQSHLCLLLQNTFFCKSAQKYANISDVFIF